MTLAEAQLDLIFLAACHDRFLAGRLHHMKSASISHAVSGNRLRTPSVLCLCCNSEFWLQLSEVDLHQFPMR